MNTGMDNIIWGRHFKHVADHVLHPVREKYNLKLIEVNVLYHLGYNPKATSTDMHRDLGLNRGHISQAVDSLSKKGYLVAHHDLNDRRYVTFALTDTAKAAVQDVLSAYEKLKARMLEGVTAEELEVFRSVTAKIAANLDNME